MTLDQIDAFLAVIRYGNFANAATSLYLTQSALGHRISKLEQELGTELFIRTRGVRHIELTEEGSKFALIARDMKKLWTSALSLGGNPQERTDVRIGCIFSLQDVVLPAILPKLVAEGFKPYLLWMTTRDAIDDLEEGNLEFAIVGYDKPDTNASYTMDVLADESFAVLSRIDSPYGERISVNDLDPGKEIYSRWSPAFESWHRKMFGETFKPTVSIEGVGQAGRLLLDSDDHWAVVSMGYGAEMARNGMLKLSALEERLPERPVTLLSRRPVLTKCHKLLVDTIRDHLSTLDGFDVPLQ